jgi:two-component system sensor histidine kinase DesK
VPVVEESPNTLPADPQRWVLGWRRSVMDAGLLVYPLVTVAGILQYSSGRGAVVGCLLVAGFCLFHVLAAVSAAWYAGRWFWSLVGAMTVLFVAVLPFAHTDAFFMATVVVSVAVPRMKRGTGLVMAAGVIAALAAPWAVPAWHDEPGWPQAVALLFTTLMMSAFAESVRSNRALIEARAEVARLASEAERNRIARDLHDLLGHSLTAITVKSSLARRLADSEPGRSRQEIEEVETLSRQTLADVRAAVSGYRDVTVAGELARGRELLRASGVTADLPTATDMVDAAHQELFGWVVREGLTNVARHARATRCTVALAASEVEVRDDGVGGPASWGTGLDGLQERVTMAGGTVEAGPLSPRGWRLRVSFETTGVTRT